MFPAMVSWTMLDWKMVLLIAILIYGFTESVRWDCCGATCGFR
jgi:hypothetical protein